MSDTTEGIERALVAWEGAAMAALLPHEDWCCAMGCAGYHGTWVRTGERRECPGCQCVSGMADRALAARLADPATIETVALAIRCPKCFMNAFVPCSVADTTATTSHTKRTAAAEIALTHLAAMFTPAAEGDAGVGS